TCRTHHILPSKISEMEQKAGHRYSTAVGKQESPDSSQGRNGSLQRALLPQRIEQSERHIQRQRQTTITE
ncbi:hypothetical protein PPYR_01459, partial [Photinus pyralis]